MPIIKSPKLSEKVKEIFFAQVLEGVKWLHDNGLAHRDLKPDNILVKHSKPPCVRIADFGCLSDKAMNHYSNVGTVSYRAPEQIEGKYHFNSVDMWALGVIAWEFIQKSVGMGRIDGERLTAIHRNLATSKSVFAKYCLATLVIDLSRRIKAGQALRLYKESRGKCSSKQGDRLKQDVGSQKRKRISGSDSLPQSNRHAQNNPIKRNDSPEHIFGSTEHDRPSKMIKSEQIKREEAAPGLSP